MDEMDAQIQELATDNERLQAQLAEQGAKLERADAECTAATERATALVGELSEARLELSQSRNLTSGSLAEMVARIEASVEALGSSRASSKGADRKAVAPAANPSKQKVHIMTENHYFLFAGDDRSRRIFHGSLDAALRAAANHDDPRVADARFSTVTDKVEAALGALEESGHPELVAVAGQARCKHGWLRETALYAALCGTAYEAFQDFRPELEDWQPEYWAGAGGRLGSSTTRSMKSAIASRIACFARSRWSARFGLNACP